MKEKEQEEEKKEQEEEERKKELAGRGVSTPTFTLHHP